MIGAEGNAASPPPPSGVTPDLLETSAAPAAGLPFPAPLADWPAPSIRPHVEARANGLRPAAAAPAATTWLDVRDVTRLLVAAMLALTLGHLAAMYVHHGLGYDYALGLVPLFDFNLEANAPTWFSSALLLGVGIVAALVARVSPAMRGYWLAVAGVATFLSLDESVQLHELLSGILRRGLAVGPGFSLAIVAIVSLLPVAIGAAVFYRFVRALPRPTAVGLLAAAAVYLGGAVGVDTLVALLADGAAGGATTLALHTVEELLEMSGLILAIHVLLTHLRDHAGRGHPAAA